jgi:hypothetical protein
MITLSNTSKQKRGLLALLSVILSGLALQVPPINAQAACPNISGPFQRKTDNLIIDWNQNGCYINADSPSGGFDHRISGQWRGNKFDYRVLRRNISNGCTTTMYGRLYVLNDSQLTTEIYGTDGRCDLPTAFTETSIWSRR